MTAVSDQDRVPTVVTVVLGCGAVAAFLGWLTWTELRDGVLELPSRSMAPAQHRYYTGTDSPMFWVWVVLQLVFCLFCTRIAVAVVIRALRVNRRLRRRRLSR